MSRRNSGGRALGGHHATQASIVYNTITIRHDRGHGSSFRGRKNNMIRISTIYNIPWARGGGILYLRKGRLPNRRWAGSAGTELDGKALGGLLEMKLRWTNDTSRHEHDDIHNFHIYPRPSYRRMGMARSRKGCREWYLCRWSWNMHRGFSMWLDAIYPSGGALL